MCVTSLLCGPRADLWPFNGFLCEQFSLYIKVYQGWALQRSGSTDPLKENGRKFAPGNTRSSSFHSLSCFKTPLHGERIKGRKSLQPFPSETIDRGSAWTPRYRWQIATRPETQITHTRGGRQSYAPVDTTGKQREQENVYRSIMSSFP